MPRLSEPYPFARGATVTREIKRGMSGETFTAEELDVLGEALDEFQQLRRYAGEISTGDDRKVKFARAGVADRLLERIRIDEEKG